MTEKLNSLLDQLAAISPMPEDSELTTEILKEYEDILVGLSEYRDSNMISPLIDSFGYGDAFELYWTTLHLLEKLDWDELYAALLKAINEGERGSRLWATHMLMRFRKPEAVPGIIQLLSDPNDLIRAQALGALSVLEPSNIAEHIAKLKNDPSPKVKSEILHIERSLD